MARTGFEKLLVYQLAEEISDLAWQAARDWDKMAQDTVGKQLIIAADNIGAYIAEGTGCGSYAENKKFAKMARGYLFEVKHWLRTAQKRELLSEDQMSSFRALIDQLTPKLIAYINSIGKTRENQYLTTH
ncbi:MAG: four helix bundle protein [Pseudomonadota bacterium]